jgi:hypothetical protein
MLFFNPVRHTSETGRAITLHFRIVSFLLVTPLKNGVQKKPFYNRKENYLDPGSSPG